MATVSRRCFAILILAFGASGTSLIEETANGQNARLLRREEKNNQVDSGDFKKDVKPHKQEDDESGIDAEAASDDTTGTDADATQEASSDDSVEDANKEEETDGDESADAPSLSGTGEQAPDDSDNSDDAKDEEGASADSENSDDSTDEGDASAEDTDGVAATDDHDGEKSEDSDEDADGDVTDSDDTDEDDASESASMLAESPTLLTNESDASVDKASESSPADDSEDEDDEEDEAADEEEYEEEDQEEDASLHHLEDQMAEVSEAANSAKKDQGTDQAPATEAADKASLLQLQEKERANTTSVVKSRAGHQVHHQSDYRTMTDEERNNALAMTDDELREKEEDLELYNMRDPTSPWDD